jgi:chromosome segregation ATPase
MRKIYKYNEETKVSEVIFTKGKIRARAKSKPHQDDFEYANKIVGLQITEFKALIKFLKKRISSKENKIEKLKNQVASIEKEIEADNAEILELEEILKEYVNKKHEFYEQLRNPKPRIKWKELTEDMMNKEFKEVLESEDKK